MTLTVVDGQGNDVRRIATAVPADSDRLLQATWDGRTNAGRRAPDGRYLLRVNLRKAGRAVTLHPGVYVDTAAPRPTVFAGGRANRWITGPVAGPVAYRVRGVASRRPTEITIMRTDGGAPRPVARAELAPGVRRGVWNGKAGGAPAPPGTYMVVATVRDTAGNVGRSAPADPLPGTVARPARDQRAQAARQPAGRSGAPRRLRALRRRLPRPAVRVERPAHRRIARRQPGPQAQRRRAHRAGARGPVGRVRARRAGGERHQAGAVRRPGRRARPDPRRAPGRHVVRPRRARRRPRRPAQHAPATAARPTTRACSPRACRTASPTRSRRCSCSSTASTSPTT